MKPKNDLHGFGRGDDLDVHKAPEVEEVPVSGDDQFGVVIRSEGEEEVVERVFFDDGWNRSRVLHKSDMSQEIGHDVLWGGV